MTVPSRSLDPRTPVLVGVGQLDVPADAADPSDEPMDLMERALRSAADDAGAPGLLAVIDAVRVVAILSWRYTDPAAALAARVGSGPVSTAVSPMGGNSPQMLVNRSALDIRAGRHDVVVIAGAEAWRTRQAFRRRGENPPWTEADPTTPPAEVIGTDMQMSHPAEQARGISMPIHAYPIFEVAIRSAEGTAPAEHMAQISELWASFSEVAAGNPHAAVRQGFSAEALRTPSPDNRWVGYPYTKWMVSNDRVDQAAALILCSAERAESLGISRDRWVFPWSGTDTAEPTMSERHHLHRSPAVRIGGGRALDLAGVGVDDLAHVDLYSCFPSAVQIGASELGLGLDRQLTVTGGLTFAGGPWNNYVTHSIATMARVLRDDPGSIGLCTANGGLISKHSFGVYSTEPPSGGFRHEAPQAEVDAVEHREVVPDHEGPVTVEAYTVMHGREGDAEVALTSCLLPDGRRTWARSSDPDLMASFVAEECCGRAAEVRPGGELHLT